MGRISTPSFTIDVEADGQTDLLDSPAPSLRARILSVWRLLGRSGTVQRGVSGPVISGLDFRDDSVRRGASGLEALLATWVSMSAGMVVGEEAEEV